MNYKLVAIDVDDTLLDRNLTVSPVTREVIGKAQSQGVTVTLATGRMFRSAQRIAQSLDLNCPLITYNGALVKNALDDFVYSHQPISLPLAKTIITGLRNGGYHVNCYVEDQLYVEEINGKVQDYTRVAGVPALMVGDLTTFLNAPPTKLLVIDDEHRLNRLAKELKKSYGEQISLTKSKPYYLEILHRNVSKGQGLEGVCQHLDIHPEEVVAIGDSYNDLEMIRFAGLGVMMGNAGETLKKEADYVAPPNWENGVADVFIHFILRKE